MKMNRRLLPVLPAMLALLFMLSTPTLAQTFRGSINGTITDPSGAVVAGAKVTAVDVATGGARETVSSGAGEFLFSDIPQSTYTIKVIATGFQTTEVSGVQVLTGKIYTLPVKLAVSQQATTVEVSAAALALDTTTVVQTTTLDGTALQDVPLNGRDFTQLQATSVSFSGYGRFHGGICIRSQHHPGHAGTVHLHAHRLAFCPGHLAGYAEAEHQPRPALRL